MRVLAFAVHLCKPVWRLVGLWTLPLAQVIGVICGAAALILWPGITLTIVAAVLTVLGLAAIYEEWVCWNEQIESDIGITLWAELRCGWWKQ